MLCRLPPPQETEIGLAQPALGTHCPQKITVFHFLEFEVQNKVSKLGPTLAVSVKATGKGKRNPPSSQLPLQLTELAPQVRPNPI